MKLIRGDKVKSSRYGIMFCVYCGVSSVIAAKCGPTFYT